MVFGAFKPKVVEFKEDSPTLEIAGMISRKALDFADEIAEQPINAQKIKDAELV
jgi:hypothetical protein